MILTKVISTSISNLKRVIQVLRAGTQDVCTPSEVAPYGTDSNPIAGMVAVYSDTKLNGNNIIIGYINTNQQAQEGEYRIYSTDSKGNVKAYIWLTNAGNLQLGGNVDNAVRYAALNTALQAEAVKINTQLTAIAAAITALGGTYVPVPVTLDISAAKISNIQTA